MPSHEMDLYLGKITPKMDINALYSYHSCMKPLNRIEEYSLGNICIFIDTNLFPSYKDDSLSSSVPSLLNHFRAYRFYN